MGLLGGFLGHLGSLLSNLEPSWKPREGHPGCLEPSWSPYGAILGRLGASWGDWGLFWELKRGRPRKGRRKRRTPSELFLTLDALDWPSTALHPLDGGAAGSTGLRPLPPAPWLTNLELCFTSNIVLLFFCFFVFSWIVIDCH